MQNVSGIRIVLRHAMQVLLFAALFACSDLAVMVKTPSTLKTTVNLQNPPFDSNGALLLEIQDAVTNSEQELYLLTFATLPEALEAEDFSSQAPFQYKNLIATLSRDILNRGQVVGKVSEGTSFLFADAVDIKKYYVFYLRPRNGQANYLVLKPNLGDVGTITSSVADGKLIVNWDKVEGATHHEILIDGKQIRVDGQSWAFSPYDDSSSYECCIRAVSGPLKSANCTVFKKTASVDRTRVSSISSPKADGYYKTGTSIDIVTTFNGKVKVDGTPALVLSHSKSAAYVSGSGTSVLTFRYVVADGDNSSDLDAANFDFSQGSIRDSAGDAVSPLVPTSGKGSSLADVKDFVIDTTLPPAPDDVAFASLVNSNPSLDIIWSKTKDANPYRYDVKVCAQNDCETSCSAAITVNALTATLTGTVGQNYYACVRAEDKAGNMSAWVASAQAASITPAAIKVTGVSSSTANGYYKAGDVLNVSVTFDEAVTVTNGASLSLSLAAGPTPGTAIYSSGSGTNTLNFSYTVRAADNTNDLNTSNAAALTLGASGVIAGSKPVDISLPTAAGSLAANKAIVLDTTNPTLPSTVSFASGLSSSTSIAVNWSSSTDANFDTHNSKLCPAADCTTSCGTVANTTAAASTLTGTHGSTYYACVQGKDRAGNTSAWVASASTVTVDTAAPTISGIDSSKPDGPYKKDEVIDITVTFSENVFVTGVPKLLLETGSTDRSADYQSGSGSTALVFRYTVQNGDTSADLNVQSANAITVTGATIRDQAGNNANLATPTSGAGALSTNRALVIDTTAPTAPAAVVFDAPYSITGNTDVSFTLSTDTNFLRHNVKLCAASNCSTSCGSVVQSATSPATLTGTDGNTYYACVQGEDSAGNTSSFVASSATLRVDTTVPTVTNVTATTADGSYNAGDVLNLTVTFSETVYVTNDADLVLELQTGNTGNNATYFSGNASNTLTFRYTIQAGDNSEDLEVTSTSALGLGATGTIKDQAGNNADRTLPVLAAAASLSGQKEILIDTINPTAPASASFAATSSVSSSVPLSFALGTDLHLLRHNLKLCTASNCTTGCLTESIGTASPVSLTGSNGATYYGCAQAQDTAGNVSAWVSTPATISIDTSVPTVTNVTSSKANGIYKVGEQISISVSFSEIVNVTNDSSLGFLLETGATDRTATYDSGSGSTTLVLNYTVQAGDTTSDLDAVSTSALTLGGNGAIRDASGNDAVLTLPALGGGTSIGGQKAIVLDTTDPVAPSALSLGSGMSTTTSLSLSFTPGSDDNFRYHNAKICTNSDCATGCGAVTTSVGSPVALTGTAGQTQYACLQSEDLAGNTSSFVASSAVLIDTTVPTVSSLNSTTANGSYKDGSNISISLVFSENVTVTNGASLSLELETGTIDRVATYVSGSGSSTLIFQYAIQPGDSSADLGAKSVNALTLGANGTIKDAAGNDANLILPAAGSGQALQENKDIAIDGIDPVAPTNVTLPGTTSNSTIISVGWTNGSDANLKQHNARLCTSNDCVTSCTGSASAANGPRNVTGITGSTYYACVQAEDHAGNTSAWVASPGTVFIDQVAPSITNVTSTSADGIYKALQNINVTVTFSKVVNVTNNGDIRLKMETGTVDHYADYVSGSGTNTLVFNFPVQNNCVSEDFDVEGAGSFEVRTSAIKDASNNAADLTMPLPGAATSLSGQKAIILDTTAPTAPSSVGFASGATNDTNIAVSWSASTDLHFNTHNVKLCTSNNCSTGCGTVSTSVASPATLTGTVGQTYYACVQGEDQVGNKSAFIPSLATVTVDATAPTVSDVTSTTADGYYNAGDSIAIAVQFSEVVYATNTSNITLQLETGTTDRNAVYTSGSGTNTLVFTYTVVAGDTSTDLDALSTGSLAVGAAGTIRDAAGNNATRTLPALGGANSIAGHKAIRIDTVNPTAPATPSFPSSISNSTSLTLNWTNGADANFSLHNVKLCSASDCSTGCKTPATSVSTPATLDASGGGSSFYGCVQSLDLAGNTSAWVASASAVALDLSAPTVTNVSATNANGYFKENNTIDVTVTFSEAVYVTNSTDLGLLLETGTTDRTAVYQGGHGTNTLTFRYTVAAGDLSTDLNTQSTSALSLGATGAINDNAGNNAALTLPAGGSNNTLAEQKALVVDAVAPVAPSNVAFPGSTSTVTGLAVSWTNATDSNFLTHNVKLCTASNCSTGCIATTTSTASPKTLTGVNGSTYYGCVQGEDAAGNLSAWVPSAGTVTVDTTAPTISSVSASTANGAYRQFQSVMVTVVFSEVVNVTNTSQLGLLLETGGTDATALYSSGTGTNTITFRYDIASGDNTQDLDVQSTSALTLGTGTIRDVAGNNATLTLPTPGGANSLAANKAIIIDTTNPGAPSALSFGSAQSGSTTVSLSFTSASDTNIASHNAKLCTNTGCSTSCTTPVSTTSSPVSLTGTANTTYYGCVQGVDAAGNVGSYVNSAATIALDQTAPTITSLTSTNLFYKVGAEVTIRVIFSEAVTVTNSSNLGLLLETGTTDRTAVYDSGTGTSSLYFKYTVQAGDTTQDLDVQNVNALSLGAAGTIKDAAGNNATLTLITPGAANSLSANNNVIIDTTTPVAHTAAWTLTNTNSTSMVVNWTGGSDTNLDRVDIQVCTSSSCSGCSSYATVYEPTRTYTFTGVNGTTYWACLRTQDKANNSTSISASTNSITVDTTAPTVSNVTSSTANGGYNAGDTLPIQVVFSEAVYVTNGADLGLNIETGTTDRTLSYTSGSGTNTLVFNYTVAAGDTAADLDYMSTGALVLGATGAIKDVAGNNATLTLAAPGAAGSLGANKAFIIDTANPTAPSNVAFTSAYSQSTSVALNWTAGSDTNALTYEAKLCTSNDCSTGCTGVGGGASSPVTLVGSTNTTYYGCVRLQDVATNTSAWVASAGTVAIDSIAPTVSSLSTPFTGTTYRNQGDPVSVSVAFTEAVTVTGTPTLTLETGTTDRVVSYSSGSGTSTLTFAYTVQAGDTTQDLDAVGTDSLALAGGTITDLAGNVATLTLPTPGATGSLGANEDIIVDTTKPTNAGTITKPAYSTSTSYTFSWVASTDTSTPITYFYKACGDNTCTTGCTTQLSTTSTSATVTGLVDGNQYYSCVYARDAAGNNSQNTSWSGVTRIDTTPPTVTSVTSSTSDGWYNSPDAIDVTVNFSEAVWLSNSANVNLLMETGATDRLATYNSGNGSTAFVFRYVVGTGDISADLDYASTTALTTISGATVRDAAGNDANLTLPALGASSIAGQKAIVIDTTVPTAPSNVSVPSVSMSPVTVTFTLGTDTNIDIHTARLCTNADCTTGCEMSTSGTSSPLTPGGTAGATYYACVRARDKAVNDSAFIASPTTVTIDNQAPTVSSITSTTADGYYNAGDVVNVRVTFSEPVVLTNTSNIKILLEMGAVDKNADYSGGSGTNVIDFTYTIASGDTNADLNIKDSAALSVSIGGTGTIKDLAGNTASIGGLPTSGVNSLAGSKAIVIDTTNPTVPTTIGLPASPSVNAPSITWTNGTDTNFSTNNVKLCTSNNCSTGCTTAIQDATSPGRPTGGVHSTPYYACVQSVDLAGNTSAFVASASTFTIEVPPSAAAISTAEVIGSWSNGHAKIQVTLANAPSGAAVDQYQLFFSTSSDPATMVQRAWILRGDAAYDPVSGDTTLLFPFAAYQLQDGYYMVRFYDSNGNYTDTNTTVSPLTYVLKGKPGYQLVPAAWSGLSYDYWIMRYEASIASGSFGADMINISESDLGACNAKFHTAGTVFDATCGTKASTAVPASVTGTPPTTTTWPRAYATCRNGSDANVMMRLATHIEWQRAANAGYWSDYATTIARDGSNVAPYCNISNASGAVNTGSRTACKTPLNIYDMTGNETEWVDSLISNYNLSGNPRFGFGPTIGRTIRNGIDNQQWTIPYWYSPGVNAMTMGNNMSTASPRSLGSSTKGYDAVGQSYAFRCVAFRASNMPTMAQLSLPDEPKYTTADYSGAASTWTIPENKFVGENKPESISITVTSPGDATAAGSVTLSWQPWSKTTCNTAGTCTSSDTGLIYDIYRFREPNYYASRLETTWALNKTGSIYTADMPMNPLAVDSTGNRLYTETSDVAYQKIASIQTCATTSANCNFTDSGGTGFSPRRLYNYIIVVRDSSGNEVYPIVQRFRSPYLAGTEPTGARTRFEPRFRRAGVFLVDEGYQNAQSPPQVMVHVPMDKSGADHDFFIYKYEGSGDNLNWYNNAPSGSGTWPLQQSGGLYAFNAGACIEQFNQEKTFHVTACGNGSEVNRSTVIMTSASGRVPEAGLDQGAYWKGCRNTTITDLGGIKYYLQLPTDQQWHKAADWGDMDKDGVIDQNGNTAGITSISTLEAGLGSADTTTVRCHTDNSPASAYNTGASQTANCVSRYGAVNMVGNLNEFTANQAYNGLGLDNGIDGLSYMRAYPTTTGTFSSFSGRYDYNRITPQTSGFWSISEGLDYYSYTAGHTLVLRGGYYNNGTNAGRDTMWLSPTNTSGSGIGGRCSL